MGLIDELRIMVNPVVLGNGKPLFKGIHEKLNLKLLKTKTFRSGNVLLYSMFALFKRVAGKGTMWYQEGDKQPLRPRR